MVGHGESICNQIKKYFDLHPDFNSFCQQHMTIRWFLIDLERARQPVSERGCNYFDTLSNDESDSEYYRKVMHPFLLNYDTDK